MATSSLPVLLQEMQLEPEEGTSSFGLTKPAFKGGNAIAQALESLDSDGGLSSPREKTSAARLKEFGRLLPNYLSRASDVVILTSIYRPTKRILLSVVADREDVFPSESWFKDEDCEVLMENWNWQRCRLNLVTDKVKRIQDRPANVSIKKKTQGLSLGCPKGVAPTVVKKLEVQDDRTPCDSDVEMHSTNAYRDERKIENYPRMENNDSANERESTDDHKIDRRGDDQSSTTQSSRGFLHMAAISGLYETIKMLLESGEDVDQRDQFSLTPLHLACWYGQEPVVKLLLERGANVNSEDRSGTGIIIKSGNELATHVLPTYFNTLDFVSFNHQPTNCSSAGRESLKIHPAQTFFPASLPHNPQDPAASEQLTTKRPQEQMTSLENEPSNQKLNKLRASEVLSTDPDSSTPLRSLGTASALERVLDQAYYSLQIEGELQDLLFRNTEEIGQANPDSQEARNDTVSHSFLEELVDNRYPTPQMNDLRNMSNSTSIMQLNTVTDNTSMGGDLSKHDGFVSVPVPGDINSRSTLLLPVLSQESPGVSAQFQTLTFDDLREIDGSEPVAPPPRLTTSSSSSSFDSCPPTSSISVNAYKLQKEHQSQRDDIIQMPETPQEKQVRVSHGMRGNYSDSVLGSQNSSSAPQSRHTSDIENSVLEEYPIIKIRPNPVGLPGAPSCEFLVLAELFPEVESGYATVGNLDENILQEKDDKHGNGNCIPRSPKAGKQIVKIYSATGKKLAEAKLSYVDDCQHTEDECLKTVGERASQSYEELCRVMSDILIRCRPQPSIKSGKTQHSGNSESSLIVQVLRFLINEAEESGLRWDSLPLLEFVAMNHDHENAALFLEEITDRYARDITPEGRERIDLSELLAAINASREEDEATDSSDGRNYSDSSYDGDVESLLCDSEEPTSDSEHDHSDMLRKVVATGNDIQMGENNAETDERVILNLQSGYFSGAQIGEKETQPTHSRLKDSTVSLKESVTTERVSDQPFPMSSDSMLPFGKNGKFSRKPIAIKQREKDSKRLQGENRISRIRFHFNNEFPHLTSRKSVRQPIICFLLTTESINRCLSTIEDRWRIQLHLQRLSGRMTTSPLSMLFQAMHIKPEEALKSLSTDADLSSPSDNTSRTRCKPFDSPLPRNDSTPSDVVALTSIYRPSGKILLSFVSDRNGFLPPESWFEDEDCELLMECWKWCRCKNNFLALKVMEVKDQPASSGIRAQGRLATGVYKRPLWEEKGLLKRVPENFIGRNWTGKTSLKTSLVWRTNKSRENTDPEPEFLFEEQTSQLICKRSLKKVKSHSSYAEDLSWNPNCSVTVPLKVIEKAKELSKPTDMSLQDCKEVEKAKDDSQEPSTKGMDPSLKLRVPKQPEDVKDYLMSSVYPPVIVNTNHKKTLSCAHADNPYHKAKPKHLVESSYGTLKDNTYSKRLKDPLVVDSKRSESSENVENILSFAERFPPTIKDLKKPQPMRGDVTELKSVIGEKQQDKTKTDNNEERCTCFKEASSGIRAQGRLATGVYKRPLWEEKGLVKRVPENFIGRNWTRKTSLKTSLVWRTNNSRENTEPEPEFLFEEQTSQLICKRSLKKEKLHSSYAGDLSWNPNCSVTVQKEIRLRRLKTINKALEQEKSMFPIMPIFKKRSGETSLKKSSKRLLFSSNDGILKEFLSLFSTATGIWNTGQEEQGAGSDSADLYYDRVAQKVADHSRGDKAEQRPYERSVGNSSSSNATAVKGSKSQVDDCDDDVLPLTETPADQVLAEIFARSLKAIKEALEQEWSRLSIVLFEQERSGKTSLKGELYSSNEDSSDGIIRVVPFHFKVATGIWNTGQEEQGVGSDSADLCYDSVAQKVADHSRGDKAEQRPFERSVGNSSSSNATAARGTKSQDDDVDDDVQPQTETPAEQGTWPYLLRQGECQEIIQHVTSESTRLVSLCGSSGFGKITVLSPLNRGLCAFVTAPREFQSKYDLTSKLLSIFRKPNINGQSFHQSESRDAELRPLFSVISNRSVFILHYADHFLDAGSTKVKEEVALLLVELLQNQGVAFLVTTREALEFLDNRFEGHRGFRIGPLDEPSTQSLVYKLLPGTTATDCARSTQTCGQIPFALKFTCSLIHNGFTQPHQFLDDFVTSSMEDMEKGFDTSTKLMRDEHRGTKDCYCSLAITQSEINDLPSAPHSRQPASKQSGEHQVSTADCYISITPKIRWMRLPLL